MRFGQSGFMSTSAVYKEEGSRTLSLKRVKQIMKAGSNPAALSTIFNF